MRDASARLLRALSPQERAALVLKEVFDMPIDEIASLLATTAGAVKAALHRGRDRLRDDQDAAVRRRPAPSPELVDRFIERYNARDVAGLVALMLEDGTAENVGNSFHVGRGDAASGTAHFLYKVVHGHDEWPPQTRPESVRIERANVEGEPVVLMLATRWGQEALEVVFRFEEADGQIARIRAYGFCPETVQAVGEMLGIPVRTGIYRAPTPAPGADGPSSLPARDLPRSRAMAAIDSLLGIVQMKKASGKLLLTSDEPKLAGRRHPRVPHDGAADGWLVGGIPSGASSVRHSARRWHATGASRTPTARSSTDRTRCGRRRRRARSR